MTDTGVATRRELTLRITHQYARPGSARYWADTFLVYDGLLTSAQLLGAELRATKTKDGLQTYVDITPPDVTRIRFGSPLSIDVVGEPAVIIFLFWLFSHPEEVGAWVPRVRLGYRRGREELQRDIEELAESKSAVEARLGQGEVEVVDLDGDPPPPPG